MKNQVNKCGPAFSSSIFLMGMMTINTLFLPVISYCTNEGLPALPSSEAFGPPSDPVRLHENNEQNSKTGLYHHQNYPHQNRNHHSHHHHHHHHQGHHLHNIQQDIQTSPTEDYNHELMQHQQHDGPYFSSHMSTNKYGQAHVGNCRLPDNWKGKWFQSGIPTPILIDSKFIEGKGTCYESSKDKFLFVEKKTCYRCLVINERHENVLEYKESSFCEDRDTLENLCSLIPGDAQLYSLFRIDAQPIDCPFKGPFLFSYNRGHGTCKSPMSRVEICSEPSKLLLKYQACPDVPRTESTSEELQCLAEWREGVYHYLVGKLNYKLAASNEDRYRCFIYERIKGHMIKIAESGDATCIGLSSPMEGARTLTFQKIHESNTKCKFPPWVAMHHWQALNGKFSLRINHKNSTITVTSEDNNGEQYYGLNQVSSIVGAHTGAFTGGPFASAPLVQDPILKYLMEGSKIHCQSMVDIDEDHVAIIAHHTQDCTSSSVCLHMYRRDSQVIELQLREKGTPGFDDYDCGRADAMGPSLPFVTLISSGETSKRCPYLGKYMPTTITQDGKLISSTDGDPCSTQSHHNHHHNSRGGEGSSISLTNAHHHQGSFHSLVVGCGHRATMDFHSKCSPNEPITSYECIGSWEGNGTGFLIASPMSRPSSSARRYCFSYSETDEGLQVFSSRDSCLRDGSSTLEQGIWAFNLTVDGQCAEPVTGNGGISLNLTDHLLYTYCLHYLPLLMFLTSMSHWLEQGNFYLFMLLSLCFHFAKNVVTRVTDRMMMGMSIKVIFSSTPVPHSQMPIKSICGCEPCSPLFPRNRLCVQEGESKFREAVSRQRKINDRSLIDCDKKGNGKAEMAVS